MARKKDYNWNCGDDGSTTTDQARLAVLMDIRDELKEIKQALLPLRRLDCPQFLRIPGKLDRIARNTTRRKRGTK